MCRSGERLIVGWTRGQVAPANGRGYSLGESTMAGMIAHQPGVAIRASWGATLISCSRWRAWTRS